MICTERGADMSKIITTEMYASKVLEKTNGEYTLVSDYKGKYGVVTLKHSCGHKFNLQAQSFNHGVAKCPVCFGKNRAYNLDEIKLVVGKFLDESYIVKEYKNKREKIKIYHTKCGNDIEILLANIQRGQKCIHCENAYSSKNLETFKKEVEILGKKEYEVLSNNYINNKEKLLLRHLNCGTEYLVRPNDFISGHRCSYCRISFNEKKIENFLIENKISFEKQWKINIEGRILKADFYLNKYNTVLEYDGETHYFPIFGEEQLQIQKERDRLKDKFCQESNINILRIPYWKKNRIEKILRESFLEGSTTIESASKDGSK
jgi:very-short-patch-repair endonuclease